MKHLDVDKKKHNFYPHNELSNNNQCKQQYHFHFVFKDKVKTKRNFQREGRYVINIVWRLTCKIMKTFMSFSVECIADWASMINYLTFMLQIDGSGRLFFFGEKCTRDIFILTTTFIKYSGYFLSFLNLGCDHCWKKRFIAKNYKFQPLLLFHPSHLFETSFSKYGLNRRKS